MTIYSTFDACEDIDLDIALKVLHRLQLEDGDLGASYWQKISRLLREAKTYRERALAAELKLRELTNEI